MTGKRGSLWLSILVLVILLAVIRDVTFSENILRNTVLRMATELLVGAQASLGVNNDGY